MKLKGSIEIAAPVDAVWAVILDPTDLAACVPGVDEVRRVDDRTFAGRVRAAVGPIDGTFAFRAVMTRSGDEMDVDVEGTDSLTGSRVLASIHATVLAGDDVGTVLAYQATVTTRGRLAIIGDMVLRATAGVMIGQVTRCLRDRLETTGPFTP